MNACKLCGIRKAGRHFAKDDKGNITDTCKKCADGQAPVAVEPEPAPVVLGSSLEIEPSYGARIAIEDGVLQLEQDRTSDDGETYTHCVQLRPHEARQFIDFVARYVEVTPA